MAVLHGDPLVVVVTLGRLQVPARHVEQGRNVKVSEIVLSGGMVGTTEVEEGQNLYRFTLKGGKKKSSREFTQIRMGTKKLQRFNRLNTGSQTINAQNTDG